jgi:cell division protein FtsN
VAATAASAPTVAVVNAATGTKAVNTEAAASAPVTTVAKSATTAAKPATSASSSTGVYSVQVGAYNHKPDALKLVANLVKRGYAARVDGDIAPFRVRIGRYSSEGEAERALARIKAKHMSGFVVRAPKGE